MHRAIKRTDKLSDHLGVVHILRNQRLPPGIPPYGITPSKPVIIGSLNMRYSDVSFYEKIKYSFL